MDKRKSIKIGGMMQNTDLSMIGVMGTPDRPGVASAIMEALGRSSINVEFVVQSIDLEVRSNVVCCVKESSADQAIGVLEEARKEIGAQKITLTRGVAMLSIFGPDFRQRPGVAAAMFTTLADAGINILAISTSISTITSVILGEGLPNAVQAIKDNFDMP